LTWTKFAGCAQRLLFRSFIEGTALGMPLPTTLDNAVVVICNPWAKEPSEYLNL
jgi:hypothetical protein